MSYSVDDAGRGTFLRRYATDASGDQAISIVSNGAGTYNFTLKAPVSDLKARQRFVFVANDAFDEPSPGESQDELENKLAGITLEEGAFGRQTRCQRHGHRHVGHRTKQFERRRDHHARREVRGVPPAYRGPRGCAEQHAESGHRLHRAVGMPRPGVTSFRTIRSPLPAKATLPRR